MNYDGYHLVMIHLEFVNKLVKRILLVSLILGCCTLAFFGYLASHHFVNLDPNEEFLESPIVQTKKIRIPSYSNAYNPSIIPYGEGYLLSFRVNSYNLKTKIQKWLDHRTSFVGVVQLDRNFEATSPAQLIDMSRFDPDKKNSPQDVRMICAGEQIFLLFNDYLEKKKGSQRMFIAELMRENGIFKLKGPRSLLSYAGSNRKIEKNWTPFIYQNKLHLVYTIQPHTILEVNPENGECREIAKQTHPLSWEYGELRGGTPAVLIEQQFVSIFHSSKRGIPSSWSKKNGHVFYIGAYAFKNDPSFKITGITSHPIGSKDYYENNPKKVVYPGGLLMEGSQIHCVWGKDDEQLLVTTLDKNELLSSMLPVK